jgi:hypothetical protein
MNKRRESRQPMPMQSATILYENETLIHNVVLYKIAGFKHGNGGFLVAGTNCHSCYWQ